MLRKARIVATGIDAVPGVIQLLRPKKDPDGNAMTWFQVLTSDVEVTGDRGWRVAAAPRW